MESSTDGTSSKDRLEVYEFCFSSPLESNYSSSSMTPNKLFSDFSRHEVSSPDSPNDLFSSPKMSSPRETREESSPDLFPSQEAEYD